ncbi:MAG TPA: ATP-binding protein, partial [Pirellulales bacterium]
RFMAAASSTLASVVDYESTLQKVAALAVPQFADWCAVDMVNDDGTLRRLAVVHVDPAKVKLAHELDRRYPADPASPHGVHQVLRTGKPDTMGEISDELLVQGAKDDEHLRLLRELGLRSYMCVPLKGRAKLLGVITFVSAESRRRYAPRDLAFAEELASRATIAIENATLYSELREADRLKDEFLAMLAHELRNPLAPIRNTLYILKQPSSDESLARQVLDIAERQVHHMARLLDDLLDVSRISRGRIELRKEPLDLTAVVNRSVEALRPLFEQGRHELTVSLPPSSLRVEGDATRLEQVLTNLLNNAAKYTDAGGRIWVTIERQGNDAVVRVRDSGVGIAPDMLPRVFDLFVQAERRLDRSQGGVGIGLTLVRKLVELHGGRVGAHSEGVGRGSEFVVSLPAMAERGQPNGEASDGDDARPMPKRKVLVVDDNPDSADTLALVLRLAGQDVRTAYDGAAALAAAEEFRPDLVLLDIGMPGMDGYQVAQRLRKDLDFRDQVLVALTGWGQDEDRRRSEEAGFDRHLVKPIETKVLMELLRELGRRSST